MQPYHSLQIVSFCTIHSIRAEIKQRKCVNADLYAEIFKPIESKRDAVRAAGLDKFGSCRCWTVCCAYGNRRHPVAKTTSDILTSYFQVLFDVHEYGEYSILQHVRVKDYREMRELGLGDPFKNHTMD